MAVAELKNVFLSFLNPESRRIFGLYERLTPEDHEGYLAMALNLAMWLCRDYSVVSPGVFLECPIAWRVLDSNRDYLAERLIRLPIRERSIEKLLTKKHQQYAPFRGHYEALFREQRGELLAASTGSLIEKPHESGRGIAARWEAAPDMGGGWAELVDHIAPETVEEIRKIPRELWADGLGITWPALRSRLDTSLVGRYGDALQVHLQKEYFRGYLEAYELRTLTSLPFEVEDLGQTHPDLCYDYDAMKEALLACRLWHLTVQLSARSLVELRSTYGFYSFRLAFDKVARNSTSPRSVGFVFAKAYHDAFKTKGGRSAAVVSRAEAFGDGIFGSSRIELETPETEALADDMQMLGDSIDAALREASRPLSARHGSGATRASAVWGEQLRTWAARGNELRILHLSDIHFSRAKREDIKVVLDAFWRDSIDIVGGAGIDIVVISGDLSNAGKAEEYGGLRILLLEPLLDRFKLDVERVFWVPGNHDVDRSAVLRLEEAGLAAVIRDRDSCNLVLDSRKERQSALRRLKAYGRFTRAFFGEELAGPEPEYWTARIVEIRGLRIGVAALNSAWRCSSDYDQGNLWIGDRQLQAVKAKIDSCDLKIGIIHHPFEWLHEAERLAAERFCLREFDLLFRGHLHEPSVRHVLSPEGRCLISPAGALFQGRSLEGYSLVSLRDGFEIVFRRYYSERQSFDRDVGSAKDGRFSSDDWMVG